MVDLELGPLAVDGRSIWDSNKSSADFFALAKRGRTMPCRSAQSIDRREQIQELVGLLAESVSKSWRRGSPVMDALDVIQYLGPEADERAVLSVILRRSAGSLTLVTASLLVGPEEMTVTGWPGWRRECGIRYGQCDRDNPEFVHEIGDWTVGRACASLTEAIAWLSAAVDGTAPALGPIPTSTSSLQMAIAPIQVFPKTDGSVSNLISGTTRPVRAFFFPTDDEGPQGLQWQWEVDGDRIPNAPYELLGIFVRSDDPSSSRTPSGLLVGRLETRAWLIETRGGTDLETFDVHIGLDRKRIDIVDLEIEYEERIESEIVLNQRLRLEDVPTSKIRGSDRFVVALPTLGTKVAHAVRLRDRDGFLLDMTDSYYLAESIGITLVAGGKENEVVVGRRRPVPSLVERSASVKRVVEQYREWFDRGIDGKVFSEEEQARDALVAHLKASRGSVIICDPYFGNTQSDRDPEPDWALLRDLDRPLRVLTSGRAKPARPNPKIPNLEVRQWTNKRGSPPFHDRWYLWERGGLHVGTSPNGFGGRLFRMQRLGAVESEALKVRFEAWWASDNVDWV